MAAPSDNSKEKNLENSSRHTGEGVVVDIGTGDGRFVYRSAEKNPNKFFIGIDANAKPLEKISMKATRKPAKGGLPNVLFVQAAIENLPKELNSAADEIHIHFPWGSLLRAVVLGDENALSALRRICAPECLVEIIIGIDEERDKTEIERLELPKLSPDYLEKVLIPKYEAAGFETLESGILDSSRWSKLETSWARKLQGSSERKVSYLILQASLLR
ncbi:MAG TPA: class I SAM-dependent methyltransferase [Pyrinomonadaceae bacterium]|nr:class I SAM-dependent methyltransferase [Pyrinomonadaceae bacterium]